MIKNIFLFLISLAFLCSSAQSAYKKMLVSDTTAWQHFNCFFPVIAHGPQAPAPNFGYYPVVAIDTITLNTFKYKKVYELQGFGLNYTGKQLKGYMREDTITKKIFFKETPSSSDLLLYDFSLNIGDSTFFTFPNSTFLNGYYRLDSVKVITEMCGPRKHFYLWKHSTQIFAGAINYLEHIESIGSKFHMLYNYNFADFNGGSQFDNGPTTCRHPWSIGLACKSNSKSKQYQSCTISLVNPCIPAYDSCNYGNICGGFKSYKLKTDISLFPNPSTKELNLKFKLEKSELFTIRVLDITGKELLIHKDVPFKNGENLFELNTSGIESGVYSVIIENQHFKNSYPVLIQN